MIATKHNEDITIVRRVAVLSFKVEGNSLSVMRFSPMKPYISSESPITKKLDCEINFLYCQTQEERKEGFVSQQEKTI